MAARRSGRRALAGADHIGMEVLLRLRQVRQKKAEVHAESPRVSHSRGRNGEESQQTQLRGANSARYSGFKSARFPQGTKKGSGITDNCHCRTSELLIVTAARGGPNRLEPCATQVAIHASRCIDCRCAQRTDRAASEVRSRRDIGLVRRAKQTRGSAGSTLIRVHEDYCWTRTICLAGKTAAERKGARTSCRSGSETIRRSTTATVQGVSPFC